jgi:hypothetical protein
MTFYHDSRDRNKGSVGEFKASENESIVGEKRERKAMGDLLSAFLVLTLKEAKIEFPI